MLIFDENSKPIIIDSIATPLLTEYFWVLDLDIMDYTITPLMMLEEIVSPTITLMIRGFEFTLPANWSMLVYSDDTMQLDVVDVGELAGRDFLAMVYGPNTTIVSSGHVRVTNYNPEEVNYAPPLSKHQMLCHPVGPDEWVNVAPSDVYNKYLRDCVVGDIIN